MHNGGYRTRREHLLVTVCNLTPVSGWPTLTDRNQPPQDLWRVLGLPWLHPYKLRMDRRQTGQHHIMAGPTRIVSRHAGSVTWWRRQGEQE